MRVKKTDLSPTETKLTVIADADEMSGIKSHVLTHFQGKVKVAGFREGNVPPELLEKHVDQALLQSEFLQEAVEQLYIAAAKNEQIRPVDRPEISISKFVPFTTLEFDAKISVLGDVSLPDYKKIKRSKPDVKVTAEDVNGVIESLQLRLAERKDVNRAAESGDQLIIDFQGVDAKTKEPIGGADGKDYPLEIGSNAFIPGFESELVGLSAGEQKTFTLTFPKDYGVKALQNRKVAFTVTVTKVQDILKPKVDDEFASKAGPFKTVADMKADIKKQLAHEKQHKADRDFESELIKTISEKSTVDIPEVLINDQVERLWAEVKQNITYRGQTVKEFLEMEGKTEDEYRKNVLQPEAKDRVKASLVLSEIADKEGLEITPEELEIRIQVLKGQYQDAQMQAELEKPEARRDIAARMLTEKTINKLSRYATKK